VYTWEENELANDVLGSNTPPTTAPVVAVTAASDGRCTPDIAHIIDRA
jgi:hypothetical protein